MSRRDWVGFGGALLAAGVGLVMSGVAAGADGYTPEEARARMVVPPGFRVEIFASEPMVRQPLTVSFDERGRAWVIEYLQYPTPAGLTPKAVDQYLRTEYDRVPEPPPKGPRGADRVKILEDTDGDGRADRSTVFVEGLNLASGLAVGYGGVYVVQAPYLLFYPDRNKDDRPDGDPEVLLTGFGLQDAHATANSLQFGPDGWLYGVQGSTVTARIRGVEFQQGVWRFHPRTHAFELFAEGGGNTWGLDFDLAGNAFGSSNGGFVAFHMLQGGNYWKGFAKHGPLHNPNTFGYFDAMPYQGQKVGGHVTPGGIIYKADAYPAEFRGKFIGGNLLSNAVYWHELTAEGSTFKARHGGTLIDARDSWFRPIDLQVGPDGCVYVVDWYDRRASHLDPRDNWDRSNGRIYRVVYGERPRVAPFDLSKLSTRELLAFRNATNDWYAVEARQILAERRDTSVVPQLKESLAAERNEAVALRDLWALDLCGGLDDATALGLLEHPVAGVRRWVVRRLGDDHRMTPSLAATLAHLAGTDADPLVCSQLAASAQRWDAKDALPILARLLGRSDDVSDRQIPLMVWWAFERQIRNDRGAVLAMFRDPAVQASPLARAGVLERLARVVVAGRDGASFDDAASLLEAAPGAPEWSALIAGLEKGLDGGPAVGASERFKVAVRRLWEVGRPDTTLVRLGTRVGITGAAEEARRRTADGSIPTADRAALVEVLGQVRDDLALPTLLKAAVDPKGGALQSASLSALSAFQDPKVAASLIEAYPRLTKPVQDRVRTLLVGRAAWAGRLVDAMANKSIDPRDLRPAQAVQIARLGDPALARRFEAVWGRIPGPGSPEKVKRIAEVRGFLVEGDKGNAARGKAVFKENCAACHRLFDEGETIGPELTGAERGDLDFLLSSLVDPSAVVRKEYQAQTVATVDGRVLHGLVVEETGQTLTLFDANRQRTVIPRDRIEAAKPSDVSVMPEGLIDKLPEGQVRDLFKYLQGPAPTR